MGNTPGAAPELHDPATVPPRRFAMEAWPAGTRARALRHALHYRRKARLHTLLVDSLLMTCEACESEIDALRALRAAALAHLDAGDLGAARRALEGQP